MKIYIIINKCIYLFKYYIWKNILLLNNDNKIDMVI